MTQTKNGRLNNRGTRIQFREHAKEQKLHSPSRISTKFRHIVQYDFNWLIRNCVSWFRCIDSNMVFKVHLFLMMCSSPLKLNLFLKANIEFDDPQRVSFFSFGSVRFSDRIKSNRKHKFPWSDIDTQRLCTHLHIYVNTSETKIWQMGFFRWFGIVSCFWLATAVGHISCSRYIRYLRVLTPMDYDEYCM